MSKEKLAQAIMILNQIYEDRTVPKNVKEAVKNARAALENESLEVSIRINKALHELEKISEDPNVSAFTRTQIWNVVSLLESNE
ncbi:MAG: UPF0147 family protein [Candidatus Parvarchaeota archaeon]|nr:UPF0147 family protein [Candidatus Haiyanarchaeum thermophilum]